MNTSKSYINSFVFFNTVSKYSLNNSCSTETDILETFFNFSSVFLNVNLFITGAGGARKADADLWAKAKAAKARKKKSKKK